MPQHHVLETPKMRKLIIAMVLDGQKDTAIAKAVSKGKLTVTRQAVAAFRRRHADQVSVREEKRLDQLDHRWISNKDKRLGKLEELYEGLEKVRDEYGFVMVEEHVTEEGSYESKRFMGPLAAQMRGVLSDASDELGQKPKPDTHIHNNLVLIREVIVHGGNSVPLG